MSAGAAISTPDFDVERIRADFPILQREIHGKPLVYFDTAASAQRPLAVIEATDRFYREINANIHRGVHLLSQEATEAYESARSRTAHFINAGESRELVFTRGTTESINLVAQAWARPRVGPGDEILVSMMEHHSNIVPWQILCQQTGATLRVIPVTGEGELDLEAFERLIRGPVKLLAIVQVSNALGTVNPIADLCRMAHAQGVPVLVDGAQAMPHQAVDVQALGCDFFCFSGHKMYGPTGIGGLWAPYSTLDEMEPYQGGGEMIRTVSFEETVYNDPPGKFEAGTPNIAGGVGLGAAVDYLSRVGMDRIAAYEAALLDYASQRLSEVRDFRIIGTARRKAGVISFMIGDIHPNDIGTIIDQFGVAIRTGHHCAMPAIRHFGLPATCRMSLGIYNTREEVDVLANALVRARQMFVE